MPRQDGAVWTATQAGTKLINKKRLSFPETLLLCLGQCRKQRFQNAINDHIGLESDPLRERVAEEKS